MRFVFDLFKKNKYIVKNMSISQDKPFTKMILDQAAVKTKMFVNRPSPNLHNQLMDEIIQGQPLLIKWALQRPR